MAWGDNLLTHDRLFDFLGQGDAEGLEKAAHLLAARGFRAGLNWSRRRLAVGWFFAFLTREFFLEAAFFTTLAGLIDKASSFSS